MLLAKTDYAPEQLASGFAQLFTLLLIFIIVIGITLVATRYIANYQKGSAMAGNIEVVETYRLTTNKYVQIIRVSDKYLAIAIGKDEVNLLAELSPDDVLRPKAKDSTLPDFAGVLAKFKRKIDKEEND